MESFGSPLKTSRYWCRRRLRTFVGSITKHGYLKIVERGDPLGRQGVKFLKGGHPPPPLIRPESHSLINFPVS